MTGNCGRLQLSFYAGLCAGVLTCFAVLAEERPEPTSGPAPFGIEDYFKLRRITELTMSYDAGWLAYVVESYSADGGARERRVYLRSLDDGAMETSPDALSDAAALRWIPGRQRLAFLSARDGSSQVLSYDVASRKVSQHTCSTDPVENFRFAPDGVTLAYVSRPITNNGESLYHQFRHGQQGIVIDPATTSSHDFLNPRWHGAVKRASSAMWVSAKGGTPFKVPLPGEPITDDRTFHWSSDGRSLSVTYIPSDMPAAQLREQQTSLGIFDLGRKRFRALADAAAPAKGAAGTFFSGGEWIPKRQALLVRRTTQTDPWVSDAFPDWAVVDLSAALPAKQAVWKGLEIYPRGLNFIPVSATRILMENTLKGAHSLFVLKPDGVEPSHIPAGLGGSSSLFQFSSDFATAAFINESLARPPEIYVRNGHGPARRLTNLNTALAQKICYRAREARWKSTDGVSIGGWFLEPPGPRPRKGWPLVTHVHGGPAFPFPDKFAPYFTFWPYPLEVYASNGIAVFMPNYRGTHTYGRRIASPVSKDEPLQDIISGINFWIDAGVVDSERLGISGHSHGAMLGPIAMAKAGFFRAGSFAEGVANSVVMYELMSDNANREIHDPIVGRSLYEDPQLYIADSPDLHFAGLSTACLFEAGSEAAALLMLGFPKSAQRAGMSTEFIVYPQTGHNLTDPRLQRESAERNLRWFKSHMRGSDRIDSH